MKSLGRKGKPIGRPPRRGRCSVTIVLKDGGKRSHFTSVTIDCHPNAVLRVLQENLGALFIR